MIFPFAKKSLFDPGTNRIEGLCGSLDTKLSSEI